MKFEVKAAEPRNAAPPARRPGPAPLSFAQRRLWFLHELFPESLAYNVPSAHRLVGALDVDCLRAGLEWVMARHEALRTVFDTDPEGEPVQIVRDPRPLALPVTPVSGASPENTLGRVRSLVRARAREPFDLRRGPLLRAELLRLAADDHVLLLTFHHVVADHWSLALMMRELQLAYGLRLRGQEPLLPPPTLQVADVAAWERLRLEEGGLEPQLAYWRERLRGMQPLELPVDRVRPAADRHEGEQLSARLPAALVTRLEEIAQERAATLFMAVAAGFVALLARHSGQEDVAVAATVANRGRPELERVVGFLVNMVVLRIDLSGDPELGELLVRVRDAALDAHENQDLPFERLVAELAPERDPGQTPLVNVVLSYLNPLDEGLRLPGLEIAELPVDPGLAKLDLDMAFTVEGRGLRIDLAYRRALFERATVERLLDRFGRLLSEMAESPTSRLSELSLVAPADRDELLALGAPAAPPRPAGSIHRAFEARAAVCPDAVAVSCGASRWSYAELNRRADRLAHRLRAFGVEPETIVGVCSRRSAEAIAAMLGVLKAGAAYLPLDPEHPPERLAFILEDARARVVLAPDELRRLLPASVPLVPLDVPSGAVPAGGLEPLSGPRHLVYVIYTSGSTGDPKGVMVEQEGVASLCAWVQEQFGLGPGDAVLWAGSLAFDVSVLELWPGLLAGAAVEVLEDPLLDPEELSDWMVARGITVTALVASRVEGLLEQPWPAAGRLRLILSGGERLRRRPPATLPFVLINSYGPTELTVIATTSEVAPEGLGAPDVGRPLAGHRVYVLDGHQELVPEGVVGEACFGGVGVARGYLRRPGQTAERFVPDPDGPPGGRRYRTGDLMRWRHGQLDFVRRIDEQVKVRGFRVELGEIEAALRAHPSVSDAAAQPVEAVDGRMRLVAYVVPVPGATCAPGELAAHLERRLPPYMVPSPVVELPELPRTPTGKLDRGRLPTPTVATAAEASVEPRGELEETVARVWAEVLELERVGVRENFFELGGHSLLAARVASRLRRALDVELKVRALFDHPTVESLVERELAPRLAAVGRGPR